MMGARPSGVTVDSAPVGPRADTRPLSPVQRPGPSAG